MITPQEREITERLIKKLEARLQMETEIRQVWQILYQQKCRDWNKQVVVWSIVAVLLGYFIGVMIDNLL